VGAKGNIKLKLMSVERKILRRIYGPTNVRDGMWRIISNEKLNSLIGNKNIINYTKAQRLAWFGHVYHILEDRVVKKVYEWTPMSTRPLGRPKNRWEDDVINMGINSWKDCITN
jgi:hypothetical protein